MMNQFPGEHIQDEDADLWWNPSFLTKEEADAAFDTLKADIAWAQGEIRMFGKWVKEPRLSAWYGEPEAHYTYSGKSQDPLTWTDSLLRLKEAIEEACGHPFNSVLLNLYRDGQDSMGWHSDDEPELGRQPVIASLNLGATRRFQLRHKQDKSRKRHFDLHHGSLLIMAGNTQHAWQHQIPKTSRQVGERMNLTFREVR